MDNTLLFIVLGGIAGLLMSQAHRIVEVVRQRMTADILLTGEVRRLLTPDILAWMKHPSIMYGYPNTHARSIEEERQVQLGTGIGVAHTPAGRVVVWNWQKQLDTGVISNTLFICRKSQLSALQSVIEQRIDAALSQLEKGVPVYHVVGGRWKFHSLREKRPLDTLTYSTGVKATILAALAEWKAAPKIEGDNDHFGLLLYGPPGCGKTSLALALAAHLQRPLYVIASNDDAAETVTRVPPDSVVLFDECEAHFVARHEENSANTSRNLSALDGPLSVSGVLRIFTANSVGSLDEALMRRGRVDLAVEIARRAEADQHKYSETSDLEVCDAL